MMGPGAFLKLSDVVLAPPLPALLSLLMTSALVYAGWRLAERLKRGRAEALDVGAGFVVAVAALAVVVHVLALAQLARIAVLRPLGWGLATVGAFALARHGRALVDRARAEVASLRAAPRWERAVTLVAATATLGLGLAALGPVTDGDSIHYHLGVPLDWLRHGGAYFRFDWFHSRLIGVAECLNLLGLAAGTDGFGAALQLAGLVAAAVAVGALATTDRDRRVAWLLVVSCPVAAFLVPNQKPQMLPSAATTVALLLAVRRFDAFTLEDAFLTFVCAAFALGSKISFLLSAGFAILLGLVASRRSGHLRGALAVAAASVGVLWLPLLCRSYAFFGDPISPFLERLKAHPDPAILGFAKYLRDCGGERTVANLVRLPLAILATPNPGALTTVLGLGALAFIPALGVRGQARLLLWFALASTVTCLFLGQIAPRFFLEPYLWAGAALAAAPWSRVKKLVVGGIFLQGALAAAIAAYAAATIFPGALTPALRDTVLTRRATGYLEGKWLDALLPADAVIVEPRGRFHLFSPRPFAVADPAMADVPPADGDARLAALLDSFGIDHFVFDHPPGSDPYGRFVASCGKRLTQPTLFPIATRNPLNRASYTAEVFSVRDCAVTLRGPRP